MTEFVRVAVNVPSPAGVFDYVVPDRLAGQIQPGNLVLVPFGTKNVHAVVIESIAKSSVVGTKEIASLGDPQPVMTPASLAYNVTNEGGVYGTIRLLKNIMGMWLLQECRRAWALDVGDPFAVPAGVGGVVGGLDGGGLSDREAVVDGDDLAVDQNDIGCGCSGCRCRAEANHAHDQ